MVQTEQMPTAITPHIKMGIYRVVYEGPDQGVVMTSLSTVMWADVSDPETGKKCKAKWAKGGGCVIVGPLKKGAKGIIKLIVIGR